MDINLSELDAVRVSGDWLSVGAANRELLVVSVIDDTDEEGSSTGHDDVVGSGRALIWQSGNKLVAVPVDRIEATRWKT